jgi:hypothetical protein
VESIARGFAVIADQTEATWNLSRGDLIPQGVLTLESGTVQLELFSGVTVIIEGAAQFEIVSAMEMHVGEGKVRALVPSPAHGFRLRKANGEVVDLGTEFAIDVQDDHADIHILDGEIEWHPNDQVMQTLISGQAIRWSADGYGTPLSFDSTQFARIAEVEQSLAELRQDRRQAWLSQAQRLHDDPRVISYFPMTQAGDWTRQLTDTSAHRHDGTIVRALPVADRWEHSHAALDFSPTGSRIRLDVPGTYESLTFYCWTKIDSLDRWYNSLFLTDGHELHEPHWQIMNDRRLFFSVKAHDRKGPGNPDKHICYSPSFWTPNLSGQWIQVATTFDSATKKVVHYVVID